jgi:hypothetical protein
MKTLSKQLMEAIERYKKKKDCLNCAELNDKCVCYNPNCSPVLLTQWKPKET